MSSFLAPVIALVTDRFTDCRTARRAEQIRDAILVLTDGIEADTVVAAALLRVRSLRRGRQISCSAALRAVAPRQTAYYPAQRVWGRLIAASVPRPLAALP